MSFEFHCYAERKENGVWRAFPEPTSQKYGQKNRAYPVEVAEILGYSNLVAALGDDIRGRYQVPPILGRRGLPEDLSAYFQDYLTNGGEEHYYGYSWFLLKELLEFDWAKKFQLEAYAPPWCTDLLEQKDALTTMPELWQHLSPEPGKETVRLKLDVSYQEFVESALYEPFVSQLASLRQPDSTRVIFWFY